MFQRLISVTPLLVALCGLLAGSCGSGDADAPPPANTDAADSIPQVGLARAASLHATIRSAGESCAGVTKTFLQGPLDDGDVWNAECSDGPTYGIVTTPDDSEVMTCEALEAKTGTECFTKF